MAGGGIKQEKKKKPKKRTAGVLLHTRAHTPLNPETVFRFSLLGPHAAAGFPHSGPEDPEENPGIAARRVFDLASQPVL